jgi:hypothetical protein
MNQVVTFEQRVKERLRENFMDLIPDEQLQTLVDREVADFRARVLPKLIQDELTEKYKAAIREELAKPEYQQQWAQGGQWAAAEMVKKIVTENAGSILAGLVSNTVQQAIFQMQSSGMLR